MSPGLKSTNLYGPVPTGFRLVGASRDLAAGVRPEQVLRDHHPFGSDEGGGPERRGLGIEDADGVVVDLLDRQVLPDGDRHAGARRVLDELPGEDAVVGGEGLAVVPGDALLQLPGDRLAVGREAAVVAARNLGGEDGHQVAVVVPRGQRLVEHARAFLVLRAVGEVRLQQRRALPPQGLQRAAAAALGRLVGRRRLRLRDARVHQQHRRHGRGQAEPDHPLDEPAPGQLAGAHVFDQGTQFTLLHRSSPQS